MEERASYLLPSMHFRELAAICSLAPWPMPVRTSRLLSIRLPRSTSRDRAFEKVTRRGIGATKYHVQVEAQHAHRHLSGIVKIIEKAGLTERVKRDALAVFQRLGEAEAECIA